MVMNVGRLKSGRTQAVADEIVQVVRAVPGIPVKVILETCLLTEEEKVAACRLVRDSGAAFVRRPPGFHPAGGATVATSGFLPSRSGAEFGVKAAGGIRTLKDALACWRPGPIASAPPPARRILAAIPSIETSRVRSPPRLAANPALAQEHPLPPDSSPDNGYRVVPFGWRVALVLSRLCSSISPDLAARRSGSHWASLFSEVPCPNGSRSPTAPILMMPSCSSPGARQGGPS